jgi:hypothetical protein
MDDVPFDVAYDPTEVRLSRSAARWARRYGCIRP